MSDRAGGMDERDVDERFASIISQWDSPLPVAEGLDAPDAEPEAPGVDDSDDAGPGPDEAADTTEGPAPREDPPSAADDPQDAADAAPASRPSWVNPSPMDVVVSATAWRAAKPSDPEDEHFEPPAVRLPPQEDLHFWGAVIGLVAGPLMLLYVAMARPFHSTRWFIASVLVSVAGFALLVLRQPTHRDPTSGDDGSRI